MEILTSGVQHAHRLARHCPRPHRYRRRPHPGIPSSGFPCSNSNPALDALGRGLAFRLLRRLQLVFLLDRVSSYVATPSDPWNPSLMVPGTLAASLHALFALQINHEDWPRFWMGKNSTGSRHQITRTGAAITGLQIPPPGAGYGESRPQMMTVSSCEPEANMLPSGENSTRLTPSS